MPSPKPAGSIDEGLEKPFFYAVPNQAGGNVWLSTGSVSIFDYYEIVYLAQKEGKVTILTGLHGTPAGGEVAEIGFFKTDRLFFGLNKNTRVINYPALTDPEKLILLHGEGNVLCAWC